MNTKFAIKEKSYWVNLAIRTLVAAWIPLYSCGCKHEVKTDETPQPQIGGTVVSFATNAPQLSYLTVEPVTERKVAAIGLYGKLAWNEDLTARIYSPVAGRIIRTVVEVNQSVNAGDGLADLDSPDFGQAVSDARTAAANYVASEKALARAKGLLEHGAAAQKDVEAAEATFASAQSERQRSQGKLANYGGTLETTNEIYTLRSTVKGIVVEKNVSLGQEIRSDLMLANAPQFTNPQFLVSDPTQLWLFLDVDEVAVNLLSPGMEVSINSKAYPGKAFHGKLEVIGHELDVNTRTIKVRCLIDNPDKLLKAEMYVTADVASGAQSGVDIATTALFLKDDHSYVFVETAPGKFERREVKLGLENNGRTIVTEGLQNGERLLTDGCLLLEGILEGDTP